MEKYFKDKILDKLYEIREGEIEKQYKTKCKNSKEMKKTATEKSEEELINFMKKFIKDKESKAKLFDKINNFENNLINKFDVWRKPYYKAGFIDGISLKNQIHEEKDKNNFDENNIYYNFDKMWDHVYDIKYNNLKLNNDYNEVIKKISEIKSKYSKVMDFFDNDKVATEFKQEEIKAILEIINLYEDRFMIEANEMFKIGIKAGKSL